MRLVKLTQDIAVNPESVASVTMNYDRTSVTVRLNDGTEHHVPNGYGLSTWETYDAIVKALQE